MFNVKPLGISAQDTGSTMHFPVTMSKTSDVRQALSVSSSSQPHAYAAVTLKENTIAANINRIWTLPFFPIGAENDILVSGWRCRCIYEAHRDCSGAINTV